MADILIVEDEFSINELIRKNLNLTGHHCTQAFDGLSAVDLLENDKFDLIVLDIMLPGLDGYQVLERAFGTPTIFLTAKSELSDKLKGLSMGADDYLTIPFQAIIWNISITSTRVQFNAAAPDQKDRDRIYIGEYEM